MTLFFGLFMLALGVGAILASAFCGRMCWELRWHPDGYIDHGWIIISSFLCGMILLAGTVTAWVGAVLAWGCL